MVLPPPPHIRWIAGVYAVHLCVGCNGRQRLVLVSTVILDVTSIFLRAKKLGERQRRSLTQTLRLLFIHRDVVLYASRLTELLVSFPNRRETNSQHVLFLNAFFHAYR